MGTFQVRNLVLACLLTWCTAATAAVELLVLPGEVALTREGQTHRLLAQEMAGGLWTADHSAYAEWSTSDAAVAQVSAEGLVTAVGDGEATITATVDGRQATSRVLVSGVLDPFTWSFKNHVQTVLFRAGCNTGACHGAEAGKNGFALSLRGFDHVSDYNALTRQASGRRISPGNPEDSLVLLKATHAVPHEGGERFTEDSQAYQIILDWIRGGATPPNDADPEITSLEIFPDALTLGAEAAQQLVVRAHYDDGSYEDVTPWVKFDTTDDGVAVVDEDGRITVAGPGSTAITVFYASRVNSAEVSVPRAEPVDPEVYAQSPLHNYIDELVLEKLESLQIAPSGQAEDATFIRRAYLDAMGVLPSPEEVQAFVADTAEDKRAQLIETILLRPEFVDYWAYKWSDLLLISSRNVTRPEELHAFYRYVRESVAENKPWDQFTREIITATGNTLENGAGVYYVMHKETNVLTETTSQTFLATSVTCARCHNHPLEKWTQDEYYGMANLFARVKLKVGDAPNSTDILPASFGDILHPRLGAPMPPKPLDGEELPLDARGDRREHFADWLTAAENPYFTRAIVNRVWANFMGRGLVDPEDDLRLTNPPSNEALMAALEADMIAHGWDVRHLVRTIMNSAAYQRASTPSDPDTPDTKYYSQYIIKRLKAEVILDAYAGVTQVPTPFPGYPEGTRALQLRDSEVASYFLTAFGRPERKQTCACERTEDANIAQTLHLANGETLNDKLRDDASIAARLVEEGLGDMDVVHRLFLRTLARYPAPEERAEAAAMLREAANGGGEDSPESRRHAIEDLAWALMSSKEFLFNN